MAIIQMAPQKKSFWPVGSWSMLDDSQMSGKEMSSDMLVAKRNFTFTTRSKPSGDMPTIQSRFPSSENCGYTNRVVSVARFNAHAARFIKLTSLKK